MKRKHLEMGYLQYFETITVDMSMPISSANASKNYLNFYFMHKLNALIYQKSVVALIEKNFKHSFQTDRYFCI